MDHILNNFWIGSQEDADFLMRENPEGITAILNVRGRDAYHPAGRDQSAQHPGKAYKYIAAPDIGIIYPKQVREASVWLEEQTTSNRKILIHCMHGISRSPGFLAAYMVKSRISSNLDEAKAAISIRRHVLPATQLVEQEKPVTLISAVTGLPDRHAFDKGKTSPFGAIVDVVLMKTFNDSYGTIAGDALLRRLGKILIGVGLDAYYDRGDEFLCKGSSREELEAKLSQARQLFQDPFQIYAEGRIRTIEQTDFSYGVGTGPEEQRGALNEAKREISRNDAPEWLRNVIAEGGF